LTACQVAKDVNIIRRDALILTEKGIILKHCVCVVERKRKKERERETERKRDR